MTTALLELAEGRDSEKFICVRVRVRIAQSFLILFYFILFIYLFIYTILNEGGTISYK